MGNKGKRGKRGQSYNGSRSSKGPKRSQGRQNQRGGKRGAAGGIGANQSPRAFGNKMMTGRRKIREGGIALRYQPVIFHRADDYDPKHLSDVMVKNTARKREDSESPSHTEEVTSNTYQNGNADIPQKAVLELTIDTEPPSETGQIPENVMQDDMTPGAEMETEDADAEYFSDTNKIQENVDAPGNEISESDVSNNELDLEESRTQDDVMAVETRTETEDEATEYFSPDESQENVEVLDKEVESLSENDASNNELDLEGSEKGDDNATQVSGERSPALSTSEEELDFDENERWWGGDQEDEEDQMSDLDDEQIYALARMSDNLDNFDPIDYDDGDDDELDFDEVMNELLNGDGLPRGSGDPLKKKPKEKTLTRRQKARKEARDEARAKSNFGRDPELWQKYPEVITVRDVLNEIRLFVATPEPQQIRFPPLDSNANWYVKQIAGLHGLATSSQGSGKQKTVLCARTVRTGPARDLSLLRKLTTRRSTFLRSDKRDSGNRKEKKGGKKKIRDGHVVGQEAAPVSQENFGHRLMTRMGWTQGSGLGRVGAGITHPISATVKLTKRGLGDNS